MQIYLFDSSTKLVRTSISESVEMSVQLLIKI